MKVGILLTFVWGVSLTCTYITYLLRSERIRCVFRMNPSCRTHALYKSHARNGSPDAPPDKGLRRRDTPIYPRDTPRHYSTEPGGARARFGNISSQSVHVRVFFTVCVHPRCRCNQPGKSSDVSMCVVILGVLFHDFLFHAYY